MATTPSTNINIPYSAFLDTSTGRPTQAWLLWLMSPNFINLNLGNALPVTSGGTGLSTIPANGQLLIGNGTGYSLNTLGTGAGISVTNGVGTISIANTGVLSFSGGTTGLTPATATTGAVTLAGTLIAVNGGTGFGSYAVGDLLYANTTTTLAKLPDVATGNALISGGVDTAPAWGKIGLTTHVSGVLPTANGGTNLTSFTANGVVYASSTSALATGSALTFDGSTLTATGNAIISDNSANAALRITQIGSGNALLIEDSANPDSTPFIVDSGGKIKTGYLTDWSGITAPRIGIDSTSAAAFATTSFGYNTAAPIFSSVVGGGTTFGNNTIVAANQNLGRYRWYGTDGTAPVLAAVIEALVDGTPGASSMPGRLVFSTTASGATATTERLRFISTGAWGLSGANYGTSGQVLTSGGASAPPTWTTPTTGAVISVTGTSPVVSSGGTTPAISLAAAYGDTLNPYASKTANYVLAAPNGSAGAPTFRALVAADVPGSALTKTDDTNVTLTLGGSPTTALLNAASLTLGWTGQLGISRGGTNTSTAPSAYGVVYGNSGGTAYTSLANGTTGQILTATTSGAPSWAAPAYTGTVTSVSFTGGIITVATGTTTPAFTVAGTSGGIPYFSSGTTWASSAALTQYGIVYGGGAGAAPVSTAAGTTGQVLTATTGGAPTWVTPASGGSVTTVSVVSANGFAGTVANPTTTPAITLTTSITGVLKGNGTAISAAVANTDYVPLSTVITKTADYTITGTDTWIINNKTGSALTLTFPAASSWTGRYITVKNMQAQAVNSASSNIVPIDSTTAGTAILLGVVGNWATMVSDGTNWIIMQAASNNNLLLE